MDAGIQCPKCLHQYQDDDRHYPVALPCGHSLCFSCAISSFKRDFGFCIKCKRIIRLPAGIVKAYALLECINRFTKPGARDTDHSNSYASTTECIKKQMELVARLKEKSEKIVTLEKQVEELDSRLQTQFSLITVLFEKFSQLETSRNQDEEKLEEIAAEIEELQSTRIELKDSVQECEIDIEKLQNSVRNNKENLCSAQDRYDVLQRAVAGLSKSQSKIKELFVAQKKHASSIAKAYTDIVSEEGTSQKET